MVCLEAAHDGRAIGDEPVVVVEFQGAAKYAKV